MWSSSTERDRAARSRMLLALQDALPRNSIAYQRFEIVLADSGPLKSAKRYCDELPPHARRYRRLKSRKTSADPLMHMKEVTDWVFLARVIAQLHTDLTLDAVLAHLGGSLRTFRRLQRRLRPWIAVVPNKLSVEDVVQGLRRRLGGQENA